MGDNSFPSSAKRRYLHLFTVLSVVATPFILFVSTTNSLYLKNQEDLAHQVSVLIPFGIYFLVCTATGLIITGLYRRYAGVWLGAVCWGFLLLGPFFLIYSTLHARYAVLMNSPVACGFLVLVFLSIVGVMVFKADFDRACRVLGGIALILMITEASIFISGYGKKPLTTLPLVSPVEFTPSGKKMPNVYHIVLDEYQTDLFESTLTEKVTSKLAGFIFFPENTTPFGRTRMALAATFLGRPYDYKQPQVEYQMAGYNSEESFLHWLVKAGYETYALVHPIYGYKQSLFHHRVAHQDYAEIAYALDNSALFYSLWLYAYFPDRIARLFVPNEDLDQLKKQNLMPDAAPILSYASFQKFLAEEETLSDFNRYVFMHLLIPHFPDVMRPDGTFGKPLKNGDIPLTSDLDQAKCATQMILDLVKRLESLGRYDSSLLVIHGDHGRSSQPGNTDKGIYGLEWSRGRSRALLLVKPPRHKTIGGGFTVSTAETSLYQIAPTILDALDIQANISFPEKSLLDPALPLVQKTRYYHFYEKTAWHGWTDRMVRYVITDKQISRDKVIEMTDSAPEKGKEIAFPWSRKTAVD